MAALRTISYSALRVKTALRRLAAMGEDCVKYGSISKSLQVARNGESSCEPRTIFNNSCDESALLNAGWLAKGDKAYAFPNALLCRPGDRRQHIVAIGDMTKARITLLMSSREAVERSGIRYEAVRNAWYSAEVHQIQSKYASSLIIVIDFNHKNTQEGR